MNGRFSLRLPQLLALAAVSVALSACATTRFPEKPEDHRLYEELVAAGHDYYFNVRNGVASRVLGILPESDARQAIDQIKTQWSEIDVLNDPEQIISFLYAQGLTNVAERIDETLDLNDDDAPPGGVDDRLAAAAIKQGLIDAAFELDNTAP